MTKTQRALKAVEAALAAIEEELSEHAAGRGTVGNPKQLKTFRANLEILQGQVMLGTLPPRGQRLSGMARVITDSWPSDSSLGEALLTAEQRYLSL
ncbi:hypothetical protein ACTWQF_18300 [Streptomyces sp. 8N114]|uniref:hypothetical protein n=1 Tax=Streptomyces sp. 8N114 TaxID=3457419 RepID=UPI003FCFA06C